MYALRTPDPALPNANVVVAYAQFSRGAGPVFQISPDRRFTPLTQLLARAPTRIGGVRAFDDHFVVLCDDPRALRAAWSNKSMRRLVNAAVSARVASDGTTITFNSGGPITPGHEASALGAIADVARARARIQPTRIGTAEPERPGLYRVMVDGVRLWVNYTEPATASWPYPVTASAWFELPGAPRFQVSPDRGFHYLAGLLRPADAVLGVVDEFDNGFIVRCDDPAQVRAAMPAQVMLELARRLPEARLTSDGATITLSSGNPVTTNQQMVAAVTSVATIARADCYGFGSMRSIPGARWVEAARARNDVGLPEVCFEAPAPVRLGVLIRGRRPVTCAIGAAPGAHAFSALIDEAGSIVGTLPDGAFASAALPHARRLRGARIECRDETVTLTWPAIERDQTRLESGLRLVASFWATPDRRL